MQDNVCTDIIDYCNRKLTVYKVRLAASLCLSFGGSWSQHHST